MDLPRSSGVYKFTCTANSRVYIGSARNFRERIRKHLESARRGKHHSQLFQRSFAKYGEASFVYEVIEFCEPFQLVEREQFWIDFYKAANPKHGLNILPNAASPLGCKLSEERRRRISEALKGRTVVFTEEWKRNLSLACMGRPTSDRQKQRVSETQRGKVVSDETRARLSEALKGRKKSREHIAKLPQNAGGETHPRAKLTWADVDEIRRLCMTEKTSVVARLFNVKPYVISQIKHGTTWKETSRDRLRET
jgi:group I intron endonuclease